MNGYQRLTPKHRYQIELLKGKGVKNADIARDLGVSRSTITRELKFCFRNYRADEAIKRARKNALRRSDANRKITGRVKEHVDFLVLNDWSPEQAENTIKKETKTFISLRTIYRYIERDKLEGGKLKSHLRILRKQRKDRKKPKYRSYQGLVRNREPIANRPEIVERRTRIGDYERDTVLGKRGGAALLTIVDRKTRYVHLAILPRNGAEFAHQATVRLLKKQKVETVTNDNGTEFAFHMRTAEELKAPIYFSRSYRAWERGTNENTNGLLRQYFPKQKAIPRLTESELLKIQNKLNRRPRKCLGFKTPYELYTGQSPGRVLR